MDERHSHNIEVEDQTKAAINKMTDLKQNVDGNVKEEVHAEKDNSEAAHLLPVKKEADGNAEEDRQTDEAPLVATGVLPTSHQDHQTT